MQFLHVILRNKNKFTNVALPGFFHNWNAVRTFWLLQKSKCNMKASRIMKQILFNLKKFERVVDAFTHFLTNSAVQIKYIISLHFPEKFFGNYGFEMHQNDTFWKPNCSHACIQWVHAKYNFRVNVTSNMILKFQPLVKTLYRPHGTCTSLPKWPPQHS